MTLISRLVRITVLQLRQTYGSLAKAEREVLVDPTIRTLPRDNHHVGVVGSVHAVSIERARYTPDFGWRVVATTAVVALVVILAKVALVADEYVQINGVLAAIVVSKAN